MLNLVNETEDLKYDLKKAKIDFINLEKRLLANRKTNGGNHDEILEDISKMKLLLGSIEVKAIDIISKID